MKEFLRLKHAFTGCPDLPNAPERDGQLWQCFCGRVWQGFVPPEWFGFDPDTPPWARYAAVPASWGGL